MTEDNPDAFNIMKGIGLGATRAVIYATSIVAYLSRREFFLGLGC